MTGPVTAIPLATSSGGTATKPAARIAAIPGTLDNRNTYNGVAFIQDNVTTDNGVQYAVWINSSGNPIVGKRTLPSGAWSTFDLSTISGNPLATPTALDGHNVYNIAVSADGFVHIIGNLHDNPVRYVRSNAAGAITAWTAASIPGTSGLSWTYAQFAKLVDGRLGLFLREGVSGNGDEYFMRYTPGSNAYGTWESARKILDGKTTSESPYLDHIAVSATGKIGLFYCWRASSGDAGSNVDVCYIESTDNGDTFRALGGSSALTLPISHASSPVVRAVTSGSGLLNQNGATFDAAGRPHKALLLYTGTAGIDIYHLWHNGTAWTLEQVTSGVYRAPTSGVGIYDEQVARPSIFATPDGKVFMLVRVSSDDGAGLLRCVDISATSRFDRADFPLFDGDLWGYEPTFDTRALAERNELHMLITPVRRPDTVSPYYVTDDPSWQTGWGAVLSIDLTQLQAISNGAGIPGVRRLLSAGQAASQAVTQTAIGDVPLSRLIADPALASRLLVARLIARAVQSTSGQTGSLRLSQETEAAVTTDLGRLDFTNVSAVKRTPWQPLAMISGQSLIAKIRGLVSANTLTVDSSTIEIGALVDSYGVPVLGSPSAAPSGGGGGSGGSGVTNPAVSDAFTDTDGVLLENHAPSTGTWVKHTASSFANAVINGNGVICDTTSTAIYYTSITPTTANQDIATDIVIGATGTGGVEGPVARLDPSANTCYMCRIDVGNSKVQLYKIVAGTGTLLAETAFTPAAGTYTLKLSVRSGVQTVYVNGVSTLAATDADAALTGVGRYGIRVASPNGTPKARLDNFAAVAV